MSEIDDIIREAQVRRHMERERLLKQVQRLAYRYSEITLYLERPQGFPGWVEGMPKVQISISGNGSSQLTWPFSVRKWDEVHTDRLEAWHDLFDAIHRLQP